LPAVTVALDGLAGVSFGLLLLAIAGAVFSIWSLAQLRHHYRAVEAAERLPSVNLSPVVRRYVPRALRSHRRAEEALLAKQFISARRPRWQRSAMISAGLMVCAAAATAFFAHRNLQATAVPRAAATALPGGDALTTIQGTWGWRADFMQSCAQNPQVISVSADRKRLSMHYAKPIPAGTRVLQDVDFAVVSVQSDTLVLSPPVAATGPIPHPVSISIKFLDANAYIASSSDRPLQTTGVIERCR
jgi:hypothetical protein